MKSFWFFMLSCFVLFDPSLLAQSGTIRGTVVEGSSGESLPGAAVVLKSTTFGAVTDQVGQFTIAQIPAGTYQIEISFIGFETLKEEITINGGAVLERTFRLGSGSEVLGEVEVTGQAMGQQAAINQQIRSNTIVNVVSKDKIESLPDQNAAETVGRLSGVSVQRENGEGQKVVIRGLPPGFSAITVNGQRLPGTDADDRSVDLSMISPDVLGGIELFKALRPDMDADAIGGAVNFKLKKAAKDWKGNVKLQTGYNDHEQRFGLFKGSGSLENRFYRDRIGMVLSANFQRADRSSDALTADYEVAGENSQGEGNVFLNNLNLSDRRETRDRYGASLALDYQLINGDITFTSSFNELYRDELRYRRRYRIDGNYQEYDLRQRKRFTRLFANTLSGNHKLAKNTMLDWSLNSGQSFQRNELDLNMRFRELAAANGNPPADNLMAVPDSFKNTLGRTQLHDSNLDDRNVDEVNYNAGFDLTQDVKLAKNILLTFKTGAKARLNSRSNQIERLRLIPNDAEDLAESDPDRFILTDNQLISVLNFTEGGYTPQPFLDGEFDLGIAANNGNLPTLNEQRILDFYNEYASLYKKDQRQDIESYTAGEDIYAGYGMAELELTQYINALAGVRYESTTTRYTARTGDLTKTEEEWTLENARDTIADRQYAEWFPMFHLKVQPLKWMDIRFAYTKTINRPNYSDLAPWVRIDFEQQIIERSNPTLNYSLSDNYDIFLSFYNDLGLLTLGYFYKEVSNVVYNFRGRILPTDSGAFGQYQGYDIIEPRNADGTSFVNGLEVEIQGNLRKLPKPLNGITFGANATWINSVTFYPFFERRGNSPDPPFDPIFVEGERKGRFPRQPDFLANVSLGYEIKGFSGRISVTHQGQSLFSVGSRAEGDQFTGATTRWDLSLKQKINNRFSVFFNLNNITNQAETAFFGDQRFQTNRELFGFTADAGVRIKI